MHEPLSRRLAQILEAKSPAGGVTINSLMEHTDGRGLYLVIRYFHWDNVRKNKQTGVFEEVK